MDEDVVPAHYNDGNRAFLQAFMSRGTLTFREAQPILAAIFTAQEGSPTEPNQVTQEDFESFISAAQEALLHFDYEVRNTMHQVQKERVYAIVNTTSDAMTQLATLHSADEIAFVKRVIDAMFEKYNTPRMEVMCVDSMQANKFRGAPRINPDESMADGESQAQSIKGLKSTEVEAMMTAMVDEGWFEQSAEGFFSLSPRALLELRSWLIESYNDPDAEPEDWQRIKFCEACKEIVTVGQRCAERDCLVRLHDICEDAFWRTQRDKECPKCSTAWAGTHFMGPKAVTETEAYKRGRRYSKGHRGRGSLMEDVMQNEDEVDEEVDGE
ncbi:putative DNA repair protein Nse1 [Xylariales sp. AK1849]|nr:putative DNA repair protein Nse1 [Xylariales sp. AK1849]